MNRRDVAIVAWVSWLGGVATVFLIMEIAQ